MPVARTNQVQQLFRVHVLIAVFAANIPINNHCPQVTAGHENLDTVLVAKRLVHSKFLHTFQIHNQFSEAKAFVIDGVKLGRNNQDWPGPFGDFHSQ